MRTILTPNTSTRRCLNVRIGGVLLSVVALTVGLGACGKAKTTSTANTSADSSPPVKVVAAENFWGSLAGQLGGTRVQEVSIITNPDTDPHDYEPTTGDSSTIAQSQLMIENGIGYDPWADKALSANPSSGRQVINVGNLVGLKDGDNPHRWYSPTDVNTVINTITDKLKALDPSNSAYFDAQNNDVLTNKLTQYNNLRSQITQKYSGTPVGATESVFVPLAKDLGLNVITPDGFLTAISEGNDPTAANKSTADGQIDSKQIKVLVFNSQNSTPDAQAMVDKARAQNIPVVAVTETLAPASASFQDWQSHQLQALATALGQATGK